MLLWRRSATDKGVLHCFFFVSRVLKGKSGRCSCKYASSAPAGPLVTALAFAVVSPLGTGSVSSYRLLQFLRDQRLGSISARLLKSIVHFYIIVE